MASVLIVQMLRPSVTHDFITLLLHADQMKGFGSLKHSEIVQECVNNFCFALFFFFLGHD